MVIYIDDENMALNEQVGQQTDLDTTPVAEPETVEEVGQEEDATSEDTTETTGNTNKGFQNRIRELNAAKKAAEERAQALEEKLAERVLPPMPQLNYNEPIVAPGEEIDANELERRISQRAEARTELRLKQQEALTRINSESQAVLQLYPELDPESDNFNSELSEAVTKATDAYIRNNPYSASVKTFVNTLMKPYRGAVNKEVGKATENIAKQVSQAALRPTSIRQPEKAAAEKSIAELEAELGVVIS